LIGASAECTVLAYIFMYNICNLYISLLKLKMVENNDGTRDELLASSGDFVEEK
jgi:hypothetical protein